MDSKIKLKYLRWIWCQLDDVVQTTEAGRGKKIAELFLTLRKEIDAAELDDAEEEDMAKWVEGLKKYT